MAQAGWLLGDAAPSLGWSSSSLLEPRVSLFGRGAADRRLLPSHGLRRQTLELALWVR